MSVIINTSIPKEDEYIQHQAVQSTASFIYGANVRLLYRYVDIRSADQPTTCIVQCVTGVGVHPGQAPHSCDWNIVMTAEGHTFSLALQALAVKLSVRVQKLFEEQRGPNGEGTLVRRARPLGPPAGAGGSGSGSGSGSGNAVASGSRIASGTGAGGASASGSGKGSGSGNWREEGRALSWRDREEAKKTASGGGEGRG